MKNNRYFWRKTYGGPTFFSFSVNPAHKFLFEVDTLSIVLNVGCFEFSSRDSTTISFMLLSTISFYCSVGSLWAEFTHFWFYKGLQVFLDFEHMFSLLFYPILPLITWFFGAFYILIVISKIKQSCFSHIAVLYC